MNPKSEIRNFLTQATEALSRAGVPNPEVNAEWMMGDILGVSRVEMYLHRHQELSESQQDRFQRWLRERASGRPLQYLLGHAGFFALDLEISEGVFIPRPETEVLVEVILEELAGSENKRPKILDIGTGSGAIAIALAVNLAQVELVATDVSGAALRTARRNAEKCGVADRIRFEACDLFPSDEEAFDVMVSNPPYIPSGILPKLAREVRGFEPWDALDGGTEGLSIIRRIIPEAKECLVVGGFLALEVGEGQAGQVASLLREEALESIVVKKDLCGVERVVSGRKPNQGGKTGKQNG